MGHLRLFLLVTAAALTAYVLLCVAAPSKLAIRVEGTCPPSGQGAAFHLGETLPVPLGEMTLRTFADDADEKTIEVSGSWGRHRILIERVDEGGECRRRISWQSTHWPLLLRGAAGLVSLRETVTVHLEEG